MGTLKQMIDFLDKNEKTINTILEKMEKLQLYFNDHFIHIESIRQNEIKFLQKEFFENRNIYPPEIIKIFEQNISLQKQEYQKNLTAIQNKKEKLKKEYSIIEKKREKHFQQRKNKNTHIDNSEEKLKEKIKKLDDSILKYNKKIDELNTGFGFIKNLFKMRKVQKEKDSLILERDNLIQDIELIREKWVHQHDDYIKIEKSIKKEWINTQIDLSLIEEKIKLLKTQKEEIIDKAAFLKTIENLEGNEKYLQLTNSYEEVKICKKCKSKNQFIPTVKRENKKIISNKFFCYYCGERFHDNQIDVTGSLVEVSELNYVYNKFQEGVKQTISLIALLKGFKKGVIAFKKSVSDVKSSQDRYASLSVLKIEIPQLSQTVAQYIENLNKAIQVKYHNLHPLELAHSLKTFSETQLVEKNIKQFFSLMGDNLNNSTKAQW